MSKLSVASNVTSAVAPSKKLVNLDLLTIVNSKRQNKNKLIQRDFSGP